MLHKRVARGVFSPQPAHHHGKQVRYLSGSREPSLARALRAHCARPVSLPAKRSRKRSTR